LLLSGLYRSFPTFVRDYRIIAMFPIKSIMPLHALLGSVVAGHLTIRILFLNVLQLDVRLAPGRSLASHYTNNGWQFYIGWTDDHMTNIGNEIHFLTWVLLVFRLGGSQARNWSTRVEL
jgi:hypothetical protein